MATLLLVPFFPGLSWDRRALLDPGIPVCDWVLSPPPPWGGREIHSWVGRWVIRGTIDTRVKMLRASTYLIPGVAEALGAAEQTSLLPSGCWYGLIDRAARSPAPRSQQPCCCDRKEAGGCEYRPPGAGLRWWISRETLYDYSTWSQEARVHFWWDFCQHPKLFLLPLWTVMHPSVSPDVGTL